MTVSTAYSPLSFNGNGATTAFAVTWPFFTGSLVVTAIDATGVETVKTLTTHYAVSGGTSASGLPATGTVTMLTAPASGTQLRITRVTPKTQPSTWGENDNFPQATIEAALDRALLISQELLATAADEITGDFLQLDSSGAADFWDAENHKIRNVTDGTEDDDAVTVAQLNDAVFGTDFTSLHFSAHIDLDENASPGTPAANVARLYALDSGGTTVVSAKDAAGTVHDLTHFTQSGTGAVLRTQESKLRDILSVKDFGVIGSGDETTKIQAAIDAAAGRTLFFPKGTYSVSSELTLPQGTVIEGDNFENTTLRTLSATANIFNLTNNFCSISNLALSTTVTRSAGAYIKCSAGNLLISNFYMVNPFIGVWMAAGTQQTKLLRGHISSPTAATGTGILIEDCTAGIIDEVIVQSPSGSGCLASIKITGCDDLTIMNSETWYGGINLWLQPGNGAYVGSLKIINVWLDQADTYNLYAHTTGTGRIRRASYHAGWMAQAGTANCDLAGNVEGFDFIGCESYQSGFGYSLSSSTVKNVQIIGGRIAGASGYGLSIADATNIQVHGVRIGPSGDFLGNANGVIVSGAADYITLTDNDCTGNTTSAFTNTTSGANILVSGCLDISSTAFARSNLGLAIGTDVFRQRTLTGTANEVTVTNGDGSSGAPTFSLPSALTFTGKTVTGGTYTSVLAWSATPTSSAGSGIVNMTSITGSRTTASGTSDQTRLLTATFTDSGTTGPTATNAVNVVSSYGNANNTSTFNYGLISSAFATENLTKFTSVGIGGPSVTAAKTVGTWVGLGITGPTGSGAVTTAQAINIAAGSGPIIQGDTTAASSGTTGALQVAGGVGIAGALYTNGQPFLLNGTAAPAAGSASVGIRLGATTGLGIYWGSGAPTFTAGANSLYIRTDGSTTTTRLYINTTGSTTWATVTASA
jgi:hypothetical protein